MADNNVAIETVKGRYALYHSLAWPVAVLIIFFGIVLSGILKRIGRIEGAGFVIQLQNEGEQRGVPHIISDLQGLSHQALRLFLIGGGEGGDKLILSAPPDTMRPEYYKELHDRGLIELKAILKPGDPGYQSQLGQLGDQTKYATTEKGRKIHSVLVDTIRDSIRAASTK